ncbi:MAG: tetratricopeptide repeat protein, partial [Cyanobacteria bacterium J06626_18]
MLRVFGTPLCHEDLIRQAPDFFDWRSGVWEFVSPQENLRLEAKKILLFGDFENYPNWKPQQRRERLLEIEDLITEGDQSNKDLCGLRLEQGNILAAGQDYETAIACYTQALAICPEDDLALFLKGTALQFLGKYEEAIVCFDQALTIDSHNCLTLWNKGLALSALGHHEEAISSYDDKVLDILPSSSRSPHKSLFDWS